jgi:hypothetical protein
MKKGKKHKGGGGGGSLYDSNQILTGRRLKRFSKKLTNLEINPEVAGYRRLADELKGERGATQAGLEQLGSRLGGNVRSTYQGLAQAEAQGVARQAAIRNMLTQNSGQIAQQATQQQDTGQQGQLGGYLDSLQAKGAPGGGQAQQALSDMVAAQRARLATSNAAAQQTAVAQGAGYTSFAANQATANQQRGTEAQAGLQSTIAQRVGDSNVGFNQDIRESLGKLADAQAKRGPTRIKNLMDLRKSERDFILGRAATKIDKSKAAETARHDRAGESTSAGNLAATLQRIRDQEAHNQITEAQAQQRIKIAKKNARTSAKSAKKSKKK